VARRRAAPAPKGRGPAAPRTRAQRIAIARGGGSTPSRSSIHRPPQLTPRSPNAPPVRNAAEGATSPPRRRPQRDPDAGFVAVGRVLGPFGLKGELKVQSLTENDERFEPGSQLYAGRELVTVQQARRAQGFVYLTLRGYLGRANVERFRHAMLQVRESDLPRLPAGEYYRFQLVGLRVVDRQKHEVGVVAEVLETGANDVYRVRQPDGKDLLLAASDDVILDVDLDAGLMLVDPPEWR
jgi:16S rRNA processing protein RimM